MSPTRTWIVALPIVLAGCDRSSPSSPAPQQRERAHAIAIDPPAGRGAASPNLVRAGDEVLLTWLEPVDDAKVAHRLRLGRFTGGSWAAATTIAEGAKIVANWADVPSAARQADGTIVAHWAERAESPDAHAYDVVLARSTDGGRTWRRLGLAHRDGTATEHGFVSLVPDGDAVLAVWLDGRAMANRPGGAMALRSARVGESIGEEQVLDERVCDCCSTSAAIGAEGPVVVYRDRGEDELRDVSVARRVAGAWSTPRPVHADRWRIAGCPVNGPAIAGADREVVVAWYTYAEQRATVRVAFSGDAGASFDRPIEIDAPIGARTPLGRVDVVVERPGEAIVSWMASERDDARLLVRRVSRDRRRGAELEIAAITAARDSGFPRMESLGADLVLAWTDPRAGKLRAARLARAEVPALAASAAATRSPSSPGASGP